MQCQSCHHSCSDLRDICPKCSADLRPHKAKHKIPITYPKASYEELLAKNKMRSTTNAKSLWGLVASLLDEQNQASAAQKSVNNKLNEPATTMQSISDNTAQKLDQEVVMTQEKQSQVKEEAKKEPELEEILSGKAKRDSDAKKIINEERENASTRVSEVESEPLATLEKLDNFFLSHQTKAPEVFYAKVWGQVRAMPPPEIELGTEHFLTRSSSERMRALYSLLIESLNDPGIVDRLLKEAPKRAPKIHKSKELQEKLKEISSQISSPFLSVKDSGVRRAKKDLEDKDEEAFIHKLPPEPAKPREVILATAVDIVLSFLLTFIVTLYVLVKLGDESVWTLVNLDFGLMPAIYYIFPLGVLISLFPLVYLSYLLLTSLLFSRSFGQMLLSIKILDLNGEQATIIQRVVRVFSIPLTIVTFGYLPLFWGNRMRHELVSSTVATRKDGAGRQFGGERQLLRLNCKGLLYLV